MLGTGTYMVLMTSIYVNVFILSFVGDRLKEEVKLTFTLFAFEG